jgi:hypothetical protein
MVLIIYKCVPPLRWVGTFCPLHRAGPEKSINYTHYRFDLATFKLPAALVSGYMAALRS